MRPERGSPASPARPYLALLAALALATAALLLSAPGASGVAADRFSEEGPEGLQRAAGELVVAYVSGASEAGIEASNAERGAETVGTIPQINARVLSFPEIKALGREERIEALEEAKRAYEADPLVDVVDYNYGRRTTQESGADYGGGGAWGVQRIGAPEAWNAATGEGATVAIVDTGVDSGHPGLGGRVISEWDFVNSDPVAEDTVGHGTHVAGVAAASGGIGACPGCGVLAAKVAGDEGITYDSAVAEGIVWSADNGADVINVSLVSPGYSRVLERAVEYAWNGGALVVSAAGNEANETPMYPAAYGTAMAVSATDRDDAAADFSNGGDWVDVAAPGRQILSLIPGGGYAYLDGTSMASAYVSGLAGLLSSQGLSAADVRHRMEFTASELGDPGKDPLYGWGLVDARAATGALPPQPQVSGVDAPTGTPGSPLSFTVAGSGFRPGAGVLLASGPEVLEASYVGVESAESLVASVQVPATAAGTVWDVVVVNPDGQRNGYLGAIGIGAAPPPPTAAPDTAPEETAPRTRAERPRTKRYRGEPSVRGSRDPRTPAAPRRTAVPTIPEVTPR